MTRTRALFLALLTFALAFGAFALLIANGMTSFDCESSLRECREAERRSALLILSGALLVWVGVIALVLKVRVPAGSDARLSMFRRHRSAPAEDGFDEREAGR